VAGQVGRRRVYSDERANRPGVGAARGVSWPERVIWFDSSYDQVGRSLSVGTSTSEISLPASRPDIVPAVLQLLGWVGWLGIGYVAWGKLLLGVLMLIGWWAAFWVLSFFTLVTQTVPLPLAVLSWVLVPLITSVALWVEARREHSPEGPFEPLDSALRPATDGVILDARCRRLEIDVRTSISAAAEVTGVSHDARGFVADNLYLVLGDRDVHGVAFEDEAVQRKGGRHGQR
jgi:hypothetical protein